MSSLPTPKSGFESVQGRRWSMEDTHVNIDDLNAAFPFLPKDHKRAFYGVYDGHGGKEAADILEVTLHKNIVEDPEFAKGNIEEAIKNGFAKTEQHIIAQSLQGHWTSGSTGVIGILIDDWLYIANVGDSEAVMVKKNGSALDSVLLSEKHKPSDPAEKERVDKAGGQVFFGRVMGTLAVSRAFGDIEFKFPHNVGSGDFVSAVPFIRKIQLTPDTTFLVIACDGLWDKLTYQDAVDFTANAVKCGKEVNETAQLIVQDSLDKGTLDNVTAIVIYLSWGADGK